MRGSANSGSSPTMLRNAPKIAARLPRSSEFPARPAMMVKENSSTAVISGGPIISARTAAGAAVTNKTRSLAVAPMTDA